jgi:hypothetical protein
VKHRFLGKVECMVQWVCPYPDSRRPPMQIPISILRMHGSPPKQNAESVSQVTSADFGVTSLLFRILMWDRMLLCTHVHTLLESGVRGVHSSTSPSPLPLSGIFKSTLVYIPMSIFHQCIQ